MAFQAIKKRFRKDLETFNGVSECFRGLLWTFHRRFKGLQGVPGRILRRLRRF